MTRGRLDELVPIENAAMAERTVIEWDKDDIERSASSRSTCWRSACYLPGQGFALLPPH